jgi:hypothetical protein
MEWWYAQLELSIKPIVDRAMRKTQVCAVKTWTSFKNIHQNSNEKAHLIMDISQTVFFTFKPNTVYIVR